MHISIFVYSLGILTFCASGAIRLITDSQHSVTVDVTLACTDFSLDLCLVSPVAQQIRQSTTGDYFTLASFYFAVCYLAFSSLASICWELLSLVLQECRGHGHNESELFEFMYSSKFKALLFLAVLLGGTLAMVTAGLNTMAYVVPYVYCENVSEISHRILYRVYGDNYHVSGSVSGF